MSSSLYYDDLNTGSFLDLRHNHLVHIIMLCDDKKNTTNEQEAIKKKYDGKNILNKKIFLHRSIRLLNKCGILENRYCDTYFSLS